MARRFNGSTDYIALQTGDTSVCPYAAFDVFCWFRSDAVGTTLQAIYSENVSAIRISLNNGQSGRIQACRSTTWTLTANGPYNDGNWHLIRVKQVGLSERYLYIDDMDTPVASDTTTATNGATASKRLGQETDGTNPFAGDIADFLLWEGNIDDADALALAARTKHPGQVISGTALRCWITNGTDTPGINAARTLEIATMPSYSGTTLVNGPHGDTTPVGLTAATDLKNAWVYDYPGVTLFTADSGKHFREPGSIIDRGVGADPRYVIYLTEVQGPTYPGYDKWAVAYTSNSLESGWTRYGRIDDQASAEDPYVVKDGNDYWLMHEAGKLYHSSDGLAFTFSADITISGYPAGSSINSQTFWKEGGVWYLLSESLPEQTTRLATAPAANGPWTDQGLAIDKIAGTYLATMAVCDDICKIAGKYYMLLHGAKLSGIFESSDLITWTQYRKINLPDGAIMSTIQAGWAQYWQRSGQFNKLMTINEAGEALGQTVSLIQMYGDAAEQTKPWTPELEPLAPTDLSATADGPTTINLGFTNNATNATAIDIYRSTDGETFTKLGTAAADATSYADETCEAATQYWYYVVATNDAGDSAASNTADATTEAAGDLPHAPAGFLGYSRAISGLVITPAIAVAGNYTSGETPMAVGVSADGTTAINCDKPWTKLAYLWDFGDSDGEEIVFDPTIGNGIEVLANLNTAQKGPRATYVYRKPGTYTITLTVIGWDGSDYVIETETTTITVTAWVGIAKYIDSVNGSDSTKDGNDPLGLALSGASYMASSRTLTKTGGFASFAMDTASYSDARQSLNWIYLSGTGWTAGQYEIESRTSDDAVVLKADSRLPVGDVANLSSSTGPYATYNKINTINNWMTGTTANHRAVFLRAGQSHNVNGNLSGVQIAASVTTSRIGRYGSGDNPRVYRETAGGNRLSLLRGSGNVISDIQFDAGEGTVIIGIQQDGNLSGALQNAFFDRCEVIGSLANPAVNGGSSADLQCGASTNIGLWRCDLEANGRHAVFFYMGDQTGTYPFVVGCHFAGTGADIVRDHHIYYKDLSFGLLSFCSGSLTSNRSYFANLNCTDTADATTSNVLIYKCDCYGTVNGIDVSNSNNNATGLFDNVLILSCNIHTGQIGNQYLGVTPGSAKHLCVRDCNFYGNVRRCLPQYNASNPNADLLYERNRAYVAGNLFEYTSDDIVAAELNDNIVYDTGAGSILKAITAKTRLAMSGNQYYAPANASPFENTTTSSTSDFAAWQAIEADATYGDPGWYDPANGNFSTDTTAPGQPTNLAVVVDGELPHVTFSWTAADSTATSVRIERHDGTGWVQLGVAGDGLTAPAPTSVNLDLVAGTNRLRAVAINGAGESTPSTEIYYWNGTTATTYSLTGPSKLFKGRPAIFTVALPDNAGLNADETISLWVNSETANLSVTLNARTRSATMTYVPAVTGEMLIETLNDEEALTNPDALTLNVVKKKAKDSFLQLIGLE